MSLGSGVVAICAVNSTSWMVADLSCTLCGATSIGINPYSATEIVESVIAQAEANILICDRQREKEFRLFLESGKLPNLRYILVTEEIVTLLPGQLKQELPALEGKLPVHVAADFVLRVLYTRLACVSR